MAVSIEINWWKTKAELKSQVWRWTTDPNPEFLKDGIGIKN